jgi:hypothetical protein
VLRTILLGAALALAVPTSAEAATCGVAQRSASYETPEIQVHENDRGYLVGCHRAGGVRRELGPNVAGVGFSVTDVNALLGGRWAWTTFREGDEDEGTTFSEDTLRDLRTNKTVDGKAAKDTVALAGALVTIDAAGVTARFTDGRTQSLSTDAAAEGLASFGGRVYWLAGGVAQSAMVSLPKADKPRARPKATRIMRCKPRSGARLVVHWDDLVVTSVGRRFFACADRTQVSLGAVTDVRAVSDSVVAYRRGAKVGVLDASSGARTELAGTQSAATETTLLAAGADGVRTATAQLATGPASAPALSGSRAYWLDAAGVPQTQALAVAPPER